MWLRSHVVVAWAGNCSSHLTPSLGTSICHRCGPKNKKQKKEKYGLCHSHMHFIIENWYILVKCLNRKHNIHYGYVLCAITSISYQLLCSGSDSLYHRTYSHISYLSSNLMVNNLLQIYQTPSILSVSKNKTRKLRIFMVIIISSLCCCSVAYLCFQSIGWAVYSRFHFVSLYLNTNKPPNKIFPTNS